MRKKVATQKKCPAIQGSRKVVRLFGKRRSSEVSDFSCLHGNERYGTCDDVSAGIASIGLCQPQSQSTPLAGVDLLRGHPCIPC